MQQCTNCMQLLAVQSTHLNEVDLYKHFIDWVFFLLNQDENTEHCLVAPDGIEAHLLALTD